MPESIYSRQDSDYSANISRSKSFRRSAKLESVYPKIRMKQYNSALSNLKSWVKTPDFSKNSDVSFFLNIVLCPATIETDYHLN
jgi:hypothetical protein